MFRAIANRILRRLASTPDVAGDLPKSNGRFRFSGVTIEIPPELHRKTRLMNDLGRGSYEREEATAMSRHLLPEDRLLELGAGIGFMACKAAQIVPAEQITVVEANPALLPIIRNNFELNGCADVTLVHGAVTPGPDTQDGAFYVGPNFTAASTSKEGRGKFSEISVPMLDYAGLLQRAEPTVVVMDVEGSELELAEVALPETVRLVIMEIHRNWLGDNGIRALFERMHAQGFVYATKGSSGAVVCFARLDVRPESDE